MFGNGIDTSPLFSTFIVTGLAHISWEHLSQKYKLHNAIDCDKGNYCAPSYSNLC